MNKLQVSKAAQKDLQEIKAYLAVDLENPGVAVAAVSKITKKIRLLKDNPLMGPALTAVTDASSDERFLGSSLANRPIRCRRANFSRKNDTKSAAVRHGWEAPPRLCSPGKKVRAFRRTACAFVSNDVALRRKPHKEKARGLSCLGQPPRLCCSLVCLRPVL